VQLNFLHLDGALAAQTDLLRAAVVGARHLHAESDGPRVRLWAKQPALDALAAKIAELFHGQGPFLTFMGSGDFHHITALLLAEVARKDHAPITLIHFDNHPDWVKYDGGMHCGSWVNAAREIPNVKRALTLGLCSDDIHNKSGQANTDLIASGFLEIFPYADTIAKTGLAAFTTALLARIETENVYITLDKDVLAPADAITNWDQGQMRLDDVIHVINAVGAHHKIVGADVIGDYSPVRFDGNPAQKILKYGEVFLDHPHAPVDAAAAATINARTNMRLLNAFSVLMA
jgi:arginase family enzyme